MDIQEYSNIIGLAYASKSQEQRKQAEQRLLQVAQTDREAMSKIVHIVCNSETPLQDFSATLIGTLVKKHITNLVPYELSLRMAHVELIVYVFTSNVPPKIKEWVSQGLQQLVIYDKKLQLKPVLIEQIGSKLQSRDSIQIEAALLITQCLLQSYQDSIDYLQEVFIAGTYNLSDSCFNLWCKTIKQICERFLRRKKNGLQSIPQQLQEFLLYHDKLCQVLQSNLKLNLKNPNECQSQIALCFFRIYDLLLNEGVFQLNRSPFLMLSELQMPYITIQLITYVNDPSFNHNLVNMHLKDTINELIKILCCCGKSAKCYQLFSECRSSLLIDIIYPLQATNQQELEQMVQDPCEFVSMALDTVEEQASDIPKTSVAKLLQHLCDYVDGCTTFFTQYVLFICQQSIDSITQMVNQDYSMLRDVQSKYLFKLSPITRIETSLMILSILSIKVQGRKDIVQLIDMFLNNNAQFFMNPRLDLIVRARFCLFVGQYCDVLHTPETFNTYFGFLLSQTQVPHCQAIIYQAVDSIKNLIEDENKAQLLEPYISKLLIQLCQTLHSCEFNEQYELVKTILKLHSGVIGDDVLGMVLSLLVSKILHDQQAVSQGNKDHQMWINQCWNILKTLPEIPGLFPKFASLIEQQLSPLYGLLENPEHIDFEEDIFVLISQFIEKTLVVTELQRAVLITCPIVLTKQHNRLGQMFEMFNFMISHGQWVFQDVQLQEIFINMIITVLFAENDMVNEADQSEGLLIFQLLIQNINRNISDNNLAKLLQAVMTRSNQQISNDFFKSRLIGVFLSAIQVDEIRTLQLAQQLGCQLFDIILVAQNYCQVGYDTKLYVSAICQLLTTNAAFPKIQGVQALIQLLAQQLDSENTKEDDTESVEFDEILEEAKMSMSSFQSQIKTIDEFAIFKQAYTYLISNHPQLIADLRQGDPNWLRLLSQALSVNRVDGKARRILGMKRKN